ncbi:hypothetical protein H0E84_03535 [Luteimonas sp. SJ-92]|uniref:Uncharacterized protein n=1 Tax=Luteimonas salinisoli TaxID=2752307 RepID=A0A853J9M0_9GAMM|nr:hypothetical protein [Luteimonas salinisoli]NZA25444.1 hypothetical protein [Luteimonas salinisoli]
MNELWPWAAVAGLGLLHGLMPANGWMFAAAWGVRAGGGGHAWRALAPIAAGHAASIAVVAGAFAQGLVLDHGTAQALAGAALLGLAAHRCLRSTDAAGLAGPRAGQAGLAAWSFLMATAHGTGLMLVPALLPLCIGSGGAAPAASGGLAMAALAVGLHMLAALAATGAMAAGACRGLARWPRLLDAATARHAWTAVLAVTGVVLLGGRA